MSGKVVVNRCISVDGFIAGPDHAMDWGGGRALADFVDPADFAGVAAETGAMLIGRTTWEVGDRIAAEEPAGIDYPFTGPMFLLSHRPLDPPDPEVTILSGDISEAVATALAAAGARRRHPLRPGRPRGNRPRATEQQALQGRHDPSLRRAQAGPGVTAGLSGSAGSAGRAQRIGPASAASRPWCG